MKDKRHRGYVAVGTPVEETWSKGTALGDAFRLPQVKGLIHSLVGPDPLYDHHAAHFMGAQQMVGPNTHQDSVIDFRENYFDIQLSLFPADTPDEMGGTFLIPGTQFRNVRTGEITIYQHMRGKIWATCKAGAMYVWNTRVWHGARATTPIRTVSCPSCASTRRSHRSATSTPPTSTIPRSAAS